MPVIRRIMPFLPTATITCRKPSEVERLDRRSFLTISREPSSSTASSGPV